MSDERQLRKALIRLAHDNKAVRPHILPLLKQGASLGWKDYSKEDHESAQQKHSKAEKAAPKKSDAALFHQSMAKLHGALASGDQSAARKHKDTASKYGTPGFGLQGASSKKGSTPEQWEMAGQVLDDGFRKGFLKTLSARWDGVSGGLSQAQKESANLRRVGVGRTEDQNLILAHLVPALKDLANVAKGIADKYERAFK